jgi:uncharacterized protein
VTSPPRVTDGSTAVGTVAELRRYPVKSLAGEVLYAVDLDGRGVVGDRSWAVTDRDGKLGSGKSTRRFRRMPGLLDLVATYDDDLVPVLAFPDGRRLSGRDPLVHEALSSHVGRPVRLRPERAVSHFDEGPIHLVSTAALAALSARHGAPVPAVRLRANLLVEVSRDGASERSWVGHRVAIGAQVVVRVVDLMPRCVMVDLPQVGLPADPGVLRTLTDLTGGTCGVVADVVTGGQVAVGDAVHVLS